MARSMLKAKNMRKEFLVKAIASVIQSLSNKICQRSKPQKAWSGMKPGFAYSRVIGSFAYAYVLDHRKSMLDGRACVY